jgi:hypothetical protein
VPVQDRGLALAGQDDDVEAITQGAGPHVGVVQGDVLDPGLLLETKRVQPSSMLGTQDW